MLQRGGGGREEQRVRVKRATIAFLQIYMDSFDLEKDFLAAREEIETGLSEFGSSDEEQTTEVSGMVRRE